MTLISFAISSLRDVSDQEAERLASDIAEQFAPAHVTPIRFKDGRAVPLTSQSTADTDSVAEWWGREMAKKHGVGEDDD